MAFLFIPITLHAKFLYLVEMLYAKCPPPLLLGRRYSVAKVLMLSILLVVPPLTTYTYNPGGYGGNTIFLPVTICLGDIIVYTPPFLLIKLIIFTVETTSSLISRAGICFIFFGCIDRTHLTLSFINLIPLSIKGTWGFVSQEYKMIPCSLNLVLHDSKAWLAYIILTTKS